MASLYLCKHWLFNKLGQQDSLQENPAVTANE